ncbi:MAG: LacI family transcriptional regulator [Oscillospiraceae bacterium]|nr:LacI family transcriptional regulator [Oscillospiraceae bacterium]
MDKIRRKAVTMADVAAAAGVSVTTVSHVINQTASISGETCDRVRQAINRLGYRPPASADLNQGRRIIGVFAPEISNEFYARSLQAIIDEAEEHDYAVLLCSLQHRHRAEVSYIRSLLQCGVRGLIFFGGADDDERQILSAARRAPVVLGDRRLPNAPVDTVGVDNSGVMRRMVTRLARAGYTRLGYVAEDLIMSNTRDRYLGFCQGMEENGLSLEKKWVFLRPELRLRKAEEAHRFFLELLDSGAALPQVLLTSSDLIAMGIIAAFRARGRKVPQEMGVVGFDNISLAAYCDPPLTTVAQDMEQLGKTCFQVLLGRMEDAARSPRETVIRAKIVVRESVRL